MASFEDDRFANGRVPDVGQGTGPPASFQMFSEGGDFGNTGNHGSGFAKDTMKHVWQRGEASSATELFMSRQNVDALQDAIRYRVHVESGGRYTIGRQSDAELSLVMRSVLLQRGRNDDSESSVEQVRELNTTVLSWCVPRVLSEVDQYMRYRDDVSTLPVPMPRGDIATNKGTRALEMRQFM
jgi:hypothetical protein